jgi:5-hydroxyisourate hydrolase-like protein (transthyretin family)
MGIQCYEGGTDNIIRGNTIDNVAGAGVSVCGAWPNYLLDVSNTLVYDNTITNGNVGIQFYNMGGSGVAAYHNDILNNNNGIVVEGVGGATVGTAYENNIVGNSNYGVVNTCPDGTFIATCNWWGDISGPSGVAAGSGDAVSTFVEYCPWLDAAYPDGTCGGGGYIMCDLQGPFYTSALDDYFVHICGHCSYVSICGVLVEATSYLWDWGDGTTSTTQCADHTYDPDCPTEAGFVQYWVTFTVRYQSGDYDLTCSDTALVTVYCDDNDPPIVSLTSPNGGETLTGTETISWYALDTDMGKDVNIYLFYTADNGANWRQIGGTLHNNIDTEHGDYQWSTTSLADGQYRLMVEAMDDYHNMAVAKSQPFTISNGIAVATVSDVQIRDTTIDSNTWVKDGDNLEITAAITGGSSISRESIKADLSGFGLGSSVTANSYDGFIATWYLPTVQCDPSDGSITVIVTIGETSNSATITADNTQPDITNIKPTNGLYVFNTKIIVLPRPLIIGPITLQVTASDLSGISRVDFNVDDELQQTITQEPFVWDMSQKLKGTHDLDFVVYDVAGNTETISTAATFLNLFG